MADIMKISTPLVEKPPVQATRPAADPSMPFNLTDISRVGRTLDPTEILQQNTGFVPREEAPRILAQLLQDPAVTASLIKNIYILQDLVSLLPAANTPLTDEMEQLFASMLLKPEDLVGELLRQQQDTTLFQGPLFAQLRTLLAAHPDRPQLARDIGELLKALNATLSRQDALTSVADNLSFLADNVKGSSTLTQRLESLIAQLKDPEAASHYAQLKEDVLAMLADIEKSILYSPQMEKTLPLTIYNLSRFNDSADYLPEALKQLLAQLDGEPQKLALARNVLEYVNKLLPPEAQLPPEAMEQSRDVADLLARLAVLLRENADVLPAAGQGRRPGDGEEDSRVMQTLARIIGKQAGSEAFQLVSGDKTDKIIHSLLSSPCNFTPLMHFVIPLEYMDLRAFGEFWIDPNAGDPDAERREAGGTGTHMLLVFDMEGFGQFECELFVRNKKIMLNLLCPNQYVDSFRNVPAAVRQAVAGTGYSFETITVDALDHSRSLMEVFTDLPHRRMGVNVKA